MKVVQSIERAFAILNEISKSPAGISELSRSTGLPTSTVARLLYSLEKLDVIEREDGKSIYRIGTSIVTMASSVNPTQRLLTAAQPHLRGLVETLGEAAGLAIPAGYDVHYIGEIDSPHPVQIRDWTGTSLPMHIVPSGIIFLAHWPDDAVEAFLRHPLDRFTAQTVISPLAIRQRILEAREKGYVWLFEEFSEGINSIAAPVFNHTGSVLGALHSHGPSYRFPAEGMEDVIAQRVMQTASSISEALGFVPNQTSK